MFRRIVVHHTVTAPGSGRAVAREQKYHYILDPVPGSSVLWLPSFPENRYTRFAVGGLNSGSYSVAVVGNYSESEPSPELVHSLVQFLAIKCRKLSIHSKNIVSHRYCGLHLVAKPYITECCGSNLEPLLPEIRQKVSSYLWL